MITINLWHVAGYLLVAIFILVALFALLQTRFVGRLLCKLGIHSYDDNYCVRCNRRAPDWM